MQHFKIIFFMVTFYEFYWCKHFSTSGYTENKLLDVIEQLKVCCEQTKITLLRSCQAKVVLLLHYSAVKLFGFCDSFSDFSVWVQGLQVDQVRKKIWEVNKKSVHFGVEWPWTVIGQVALFYMRSQNFF